MKYILRSVGWIRTRSSSTELLVHHGKMGILHDDVFNATPPLEAAQLLMILMMTENKQAKTYQLVILDIIRAHLHAGDCTWKCHRNERDQVGVDCCSRVFEEQETRRRTLQQQMATLTIMNHSNILC